MAKAKIIPKYVLSTKTFESLDDARKRVEQWVDKDDLKPGTRIFRVVEVYDVLVRPRVEVTLSKKYKI